MWEFTPEKKIPKMKDAILIAGLPGIANVGKISADFLVETLEAKKIYDIFSYSFPNSVFVNEDNLVELIKIGLYHKKIGGKDIIFLVGDAQPVEDEPSYEFCDMLIDVLKKHGLKEIITVGGIGLESVPKKPKVFITGNSKKMVAKYMKGTKLSNDIYGVVGPIIGVSGVLLGLGARKGIDAVCLLVETYSHPMHLGIKESREILKVLSEKLNFDINLKNLDKEIRDIETELLKRVSEVEEVSKKKVQKDVTNYIQ